MSDPFTALRDAAAQPDEGPAILTATGITPLALLQHSAVCAGQLGFVPVMATADSPTRLPPGLLHRHVLLICGDAQGQRVAIDWLRQLALASPRRHLIAPFCRAAAVGTLTIKPPPVSRSVGGRLARAERWLRRGRSRSAERWLAAAANAARRSGDLRLAAVVAINLAQRQHDADQFDESARTLTEYLRPAVEWTTYAAAAAVRADLLIGRQEFIAASAWLASVVVEADLRNVLIPESITDRLVELQFWKNRSVAESLRERPTAAQLGWSALAAWSRGDQTTLAVCSSRLIEGAIIHEPACRWWLALMRVMAAAEWKAFEDHFDSWLTTDRYAVSQRARRLGSAVAARVCLSHKRNDRAREVLQHARGPGPEAAACDRLRAIADGTSGGSTGPPRWRHAGAARGLEFLASGSTNMQLVDGLAGLLAIVEDGDDDGAVLAGGCRWVCRQAGAAAVAIVSVDRATLVAAEGWRRPDLAGEIAAILEGPARDLRLPAQDATTGAFAVSIRYGGITIGFVVARGRAADRPAMQQAAMAFAALAGSALRARLDVLTAAQRGHELLPEIAGQSPLIQAVREAVARAALAPFPVLIEGESGTGKELVARALHRLSPRRDRKFCAVNCAALTDDLVEAELFGHTRGAFTGAINPRAGLFEEASGSTLFLDEVTELSPRAQAKLLRVLQEREIRRVGENVSRAIDVRVVAACNVALTDVVAAGRFRDDLRFRLAVVRIRLPALRDRAEDIPSLAQLFWRRAAGEAGTRALLGPDALVRLARHTWPGNVRELQNVISGLIVASPGRGRVGSRHVDQVLAPSGSGPDAPSVPLETARRTFERRMIAAALVRHAGRRTAAAQELGLTRQGLTKALRRLGLADDEDAAGVA